ncbi:MAG TPA: hypothetical protein VH562_04440 [Nitrosopumilaceae archaeon]
MHIVEIMIYSTRLIASMNRFYMIKSILSILLVLSLFPISSSFSAEMTDKPPTLGIVLTSNSPFNYKDIDGKTVILGEIQNTKNYPVGGLKIWAGFYDDVNKNPLETTIGTTILEVIPPFSKSPYMIISPSSNPKITSVSVNLLGFNSSPEKKQNLSLELGTLKIEDKISLSGSIINKGPVNSTNTKIYLISSDVFVPPRILGIATVTLDQDLGAGQKDSFEFNIPHDSRAVSFKIVAESDDYTSGIMEVKNTATAVLTKLVTINDVSITDATGNRISNMSAGTPINIQSSLGIEYSAIEKSQLQPFVYWIQIKQSFETNGETKSFVEYIGKAEGTFDSPAEQLPTIEWTPPNEGLYFIETFVWDPNSIPLASKGPISLVLVN